MEWNQLLSLGAVGGVLLLMSSGFYYCVCGAIFAGAYFLRQWSQGTRCKCLTKLGGKTVVITGGNTGIGKETARLLSQRGALIIIGSRNLTKSQKAAKEIQEITGNGVIALELDLSSFASVKKFAEEVMNLTSTVDILINNAGIMWIPKEMTENGNEKQMQVNHLGHFLLTNLLLPSILKARPGRIINLSSLAHTWTKSLDADDLDMTKEGYGQVKAYAKSKLANILFTKELHRRYKDLGVYSFAVHPGTVSSEISSHVEAWFPKWWNMTVGETIKALFLKTAENGAQTSIHCALVPNPELFSGSYYADCDRIMPSEGALDKNAQAALWDKSKQIVADFLPSRSPNVSLEPVKKKNEEIHEKKSSSSSSESEEERVVDKFESKLEEAIRKVEAQMEELVPEVPEKSPESSESEDGKVPVEELSPITSGEEILKEANKIEPEMVQEKAEAKEEVSSSSESEDEKIEQETPKVKQDEIQKEDSSSSSESEDEKIEIEELKATPIITTSQKEDSSSSSSDSEDEKIQEVEIQDEKPEEIKPIEKEASSSSSESEDDKVQEVEIQDEKSEEIKPIEKEASSSSSESGDEKLEEVEIQEEKSEEVQIKKTPEDSSSSSESEEEQEEVTKDEPKETVKEEKESSSSSSSSEDENHEGQDNELMSNIQSFEKSNLHNVETIVKSSIPDQEVIAQEKEIIETETKHNQEVFGQVTQELLQQKIETRQVIEVKESNILPDKYDLLKEKLEGDLAQDVINFDTATLKSVTTFESSSVETFKRQDSLKKDIEGFDIQQLKNTNVDEKLALPTSEDIEKERAEIEAEIKVHKETFSKTVIEEIETFDNKVLKHVDHSSSSDDEEGLKEAYIKEKNHQKLLEEVSSFAEANLSHVKTVEPMSGIEIASRTETLERLTSFDKSTLKATMTEEKVVLPDSNALSMEKMNEGRDKVFDEISSFEPSNLRPTEVQEKNTLPAEADINRERVHRELLANIDDFDPSNLNKAVTEEKIGLPDVENINEEKKHQEFVSSIENFPSESLKHVDDVKESYEPLVVEERERSKSSSSSSSSSTDSGSQPTTSSSGGSWEKVESTDA